jgi:hypothetical protein
VLDLFRRQHVGIGGGDLRVFGAADVLHARILVAVA